ncbi:2-hydroxyacyl-CoA dehydratase [Archaeoglobales archaeon]|nr:MAG: 2-hydroxyacyl-CoA dehydratase [Archaeoglobales archaeon]
MDVGYLCTFTPKELIHSAGFRPFRIFASSEPISYASSHIQSYACSQARGCLERLLRGELDLYGVVFTRCCDTLMRLADIWERNSDMKVYNIEFPTRMDSRGKNFFIRELRDFAKTLENWGGEIRLESLKESIALYRKLEEMLKKLFQNKPNYELIVKVQMMEVEKAVGLVERELKKAEKIENRPKILVTGSVCPFIEVYNIFDEVGFSLVDDMCTGSRFFTFEYPDIEIESIESAFEYLAEKYLMKSPCPTKHYQDDYRFNYVLNLAKNVDAVVFLLIKFCEPHFYDYPQLKEKLEKMGKKVMLMELEFPIASYEQLRTRIEALYEVIS